MAKPWTWVFPTREQADQMAQELRDQYRAAHYRVRVNSAGRADGSVQVALIKRYDDYEMGCTL
ncbi:MAG TPA: hypothetical protein DGT21_02005 [Armatimonadetes bacterium]|nr:hypothetical protein [Armatimonadota bacterium]